MTHRTHAHEDFQHLLHELACIGADAIAAYEAALQRLDNQGLRERLREFLADHQRHVMDLKVLENEYRPVDAQKDSLEEVKHLWAAGKIMVANLRGDAAILSSLESTEEVVNTAYGQALSLDDTPAHILAVLQRNFADERRHRRWLGKCLHPEKFEETIDDILAAEPPAPTRRGWQAGMDIPPPM